MKLKAAISVSIIPVSMIEMPQSERTYKFTICSSTVARAERSSAITDCAQGGAIVKLFAFACVSRARSEI